MWYFTWFIGVTLAVLLALVQSLWFELRDDEIGLHKEETDP